jgi:glyoxylate/hydroxypyruvate reductase A
VNEILAFESNYDSFCDWRSLLAPLVPNLELMKAADVGEPDRVKYAMVWTPPAGFFRRFPNLSWIVNLGAGVDGLVARDDLPPIPISRLSDPQMTRMMVSYVLFAVLRHARDIPRFERAQRRRHWQAIRPRQNSEIQVGILGLGELGAAAAEEIARLGFNTHGWSRSKKCMAGITCHFGDLALLPFLERTEILVVMLPLTKETRRLLGRAQLSALPRGAKVVNVSRGAVIDEAAFIELLQEGHLMDATLDVYETEPLPAQSPLWDIENVLITPHIASVALPASAARQIADSIGRLRAGLPPLNLVNPERGY